MNYKDYPQKARYTAFINARRYGRFGTGKRTSFRDDIEYFHVSHNVTQAMLIKCGAFNADGSVSQMSSYSAAEYLIEMLADKRKQKPAIGRRCADVFGPEDATPVFDMTKAQREKAIAKQATKDMAPDWGAISDAFQTLANLFAQAAK